MTRFPHVGDLLAEVLVSAGVRYVFGVPGGQTRPLYDGIFDRRPRIDHVLVHDERSGIYAADGYARASGRLGVCDATVGPGATNLVSGLAEALNSSTPILAIVADIPTDQESRRPLGKFRRVFANPKRSALSPKQSSAWTILGAQRRPSSRQSIPHSLADPDPSCSKFPTMSSPAPFRPKNFQSSHPSTRLTGCLRRLMRSIVPPHSFAAVFAQSFWLAVALFCPVPG